MANHDRSSRHVNRPVNPGQMRRRAAYLINDRYIYGGEDRPSNSPRTQKFPLPQFNRENRLPSRLTWTAIDLGEGARGRGCGQLRKRLKDREGLA